MPASDPSDPGDAVGVQRRGDRTQGLPGQQGAGDPPDDRSLVGSMSSRMLPSGACSRAQLQVRRPWDRPAVAFGLKARRTLSDLCSLSWPAMESSRRAVSLPLAVDRSHCPACTVTTSTPARSRRW